MPNHAFAPALLMVLSASTVVDAANLTTTLAHHNLVITLRGDITRSDTAALEALLDAAAGSHPATVLRLDSSGGNLLGSISLARLVQRDPELATMVASGSTCASACFLVFAAGHKRFADYQSFIGIHGVADQFGHVTQETQAATRAMARFSEELGVPAMITEKMISTPPDSIAWLTPTELESMGTVMIGRPVQAPRGGPREMPSGSGRPFFLVRRPTIPPSEIALIRQASNAAAHEDFETAIKLWRQLAEAGHAASQYNLGQMYYVGCGVRQNFTEAVKWYHLAAEQGVTRAQLDLGVAYALGRGTRRDFTKAYKWLNIAVALDADAAERSQALKAREIVATRMTPDEVAKAQRQARDWTPPRQ